MRKIGIYGKLIHADNVQFLEMLVKSLREKTNAELYFHDNLFEHKNIFMENLGDKLFKGDDLIHNAVDILISFGGDGTFLDTATMVKDSQIPILGINAGRLGFLANITQDDIAQAVDAISNNKFKIDKRTLLEVNNSSDLFDSQCNFALNEITLVKKDSSSMLKINAEINNNYLNTYWADGLIIATPTGSTAYSLSCGGPILTPGSDNFVITPVAPHNLNLRPLVVSDDVEICLDAESREGQFLLTMDSRPVSIDNGKKIILKKANFSIKLIELTDQNFFKTIRNKLFWGKDSRN